MYTARTRPTFSADDYEDSQRTDKFDELKIPLKYYGRTVLLSNYSIMNPSKSRTRICCILIILCKNLQNSQSDLHAIGRTRLVDIQRLSFFKETG